MVPRSEYRLADVEECFADAGIAGFGVWAGELNCPVVVVDGVDVVKRERLAGCAGTDRGWALREKLAGRQGI